MLLRIEGVLEAETMTRFRDRLAVAAWVDGRVTAGPQSALAKNNRQLAEDDPLARALGAEVMQALDQALLFQAAALPQAIYPPLFSSYTPGDVFGAHVDNAFRPLPGGGRVRTDLSATLFLSRPETYDGGELVIEDAYGVQTVKLPAGDMVLYPSTSLHRVEPITRGERLACVFWVQSLVADDGARSVLFDMDISLQTLRREVGDEHPALIALTGCYHNLLRRWGR